MSISKQTTNYYDITSDIQKNYSTCVVGFQKYRVRKKITKFSLCWEMLIEPVVWSETLNSWQSEALLAFTTKLFTLNDFDLQCWHTLSHTSSASQFGLFIVLWALFNEFFNMFAPRISKILLANLWSGGEIVYFLYNKTEQVRTVPQPKIYN